MRLRPLTEAECYARCYGGRREEAVSFVRVAGRSGAARPITASGSSSCSTARCRRARRSRRPHDAVLRELDVAPPLRAARQGPPDGAAAELVGLHGDVDVASATLSAAWPTPRLLTSPTSSRRTSAASSAGSTPAASRPPRTPTSRTRATTSGGCSTTPASRRGSTTRRSSSTCSSSATASRTPPTGRRRARATCAAATSTPSRLERLARELRPLAIAFVGKEAYRGAFGERPELGAAAPDARLDGALRPALDLAGERRRPVRRAAPLVPRAPRLARAGAARGGAGARRRRRGAGAAAAVREPGDARRLVGDARAAGSRPARATTTRSAASCSRRPACEVADAGPVVWVREHVFPWDRRPAQPAERFHLSASSGHEVSPTIDLDGRGRLRPPLVDARRARDDRRAPRAARRSRRSSASCSATGRRRSRSTCTV